MWLLILKWHDASELRHYKPISLYIILYKIYAKLMDARMKPVLSHLIYYEQGSFVDGHSISDNIFIAQKFMHGLCRALIHHGLMTIKLNMKRAYDRIY